MYVLRTSKSFYQCCNTTVMCALIHFSLMLTFSILLHVSRYIELPCTMNIWSHSICCRVIGISETQTKFYREYRGWILASRSAQPVASMDFLANKKLFNIQILCWNELKWYLQLFKIMKISVSRCDNEVDFPCFFRTNVNINNIHDEMVVYLTVYSGADQRKHQSSASLAFVKGIHRSPVNSPQKGPVTRKMFPFDDVIMWWHYNTPRRPRTTRCKTDVILTLY